MPHPILVVRMERAGGVQEGELGRPALVAAQDAGLERPPVPGHEAGGLFEDRPDGRGGLDQEGLLVLLLGHWLGFAWLGLEALVLVVLWVLRGGGWHEMC